MSGELLDDVAIPEGRYQLAYVDYRTTKAFKVARVVVRFKVIDPGEYFGFGVDRWYRVRHLKGEPSKRGGFAVGRRSALYREWVSLFGVPGRKDRISFVKLKSKVVIADVRTVKRDSKQNLLDEDLHYSVVDRIVRVE